MATNWASVDAGEFPCPKPQPHEPSAAAAASVGTVGGESGGSAWPISGRKGDSLIFAARGKGTGPYFQPTVFRQNAFSRRKMDQSPPRKLGQFPSLARKPKVAQKLPLKLGRRLWQNAPLKGTGPDLKMDQSPVESAGRPADADQRRQLDRRRELLFATWVRLAHWRA